MWYFNYIFIEMLENFIWQAIFMKFLWLNLLNLLQFDWPMHSSEVFDQSNDSKLPTILNTIQKKYFFTRAKLNS